MNNLNRIIIVNSIGDTFEKVKDVLFSALADVKDIVQYKSVQELKNEHHPISADAIILCKNDEEVMKTSEDFAEINRVAIHLPVIIICDIQSVASFRNLVKEGLQDCLAYENLSAELLINTILSSGERKNIVNALGENQKQLHAILDTNPDCIKLLGPSCELFSVNKAGLKLIEVENAEDILGKSILEIIAVPYRESVSNLIKSVFEGSSGELQYQVITPKGTNYWCEMIAVPYYNAEGEINFALSVTRDITKQVSEECEIVRSNNRFSRIASTTNDAIWEWDLTNGNLWANENHQKLYGLTANDPVPKFNEWVIRLHPDDREELINRQQTALNSNTNVFISEYKFKRPDGDYMTIYDRCYISRDQDNLPVLMTGSMMDITDRKKAEEALYASEENYRTLVEHATDGIFIADLSGKFIVVNRAGCQLSQYSMNELSNMTIYDLALPEELKEMPFKFDEVMSNGGGRSERRMRKKDGSIIDIEINAKSLSNGKFLAFVHDITHRKKAEKSLKDSYAAIRTLSSHLQNIREEERAHIAREIHDELGQQLTVLKLDLSWLKKRISKLTEDEAMSIRISEMLELLNETVNSVRRISSSLRPSLLDDIGLVAAIEWHLQEFEKRSGIKVSFVTGETTSDLPILPAAATSIFRILQESLTNIVRHANASEINITLINDDENIIFTVSDNGDGFNPEHIRKKKTLGILGMQERTLALGGTYKISSSEGSGTTVELVIPVSKSDE